MGHDVTVFTPYQFTPGQKIRIDGSRRGGDWLVVSAGENTVTLRCPVSGKQFEWPIFCYHTAEEKDVQWPRR